MKKVQAIAMVLAMIFVLGGVANADWTPGDPFKMHEPQLPNWDMDGWDVNATYPIVLADDWMCTETGYVKELHFWGSWRYDFIGTIDAFLISFHENIPQGPQGWSIPGPPIEQFVVYDWREIMFDGYPEGWYDPVQGIVEPGNHLMYFQYNIDIPPEHWFLQQQGEIYWVNISALGVVGPTGLEEWGWKSAYPFEYFDDAVWSFDGTDPWWEMYDPLYGYSLDLSFVINGDPPEPTVFPEIQTECPELPTWCPDNDPTVCQVTECPNNETWCPVEPTICPELETECPVVETRCPIYGDTYCPVADTLCPKVETFCPYEETFCPAFEPTFCPYIDTECFQSFTWCPIDTFCPDAPTFCYPFPTICGDITSCPTDPTFCPLGQFIPTVCPMEFTFCPDIPTSCFPDIPTECPEFETLCPGEWTYCPFNPTYCPDIATECPVIPTECAMIETACGIVPTECPVVEVPTACPILDTFCPDNDPTVCEVTQCPVTATLCPVDPTTCPLIDSDGDGIDDCNDNCPNYPNGPLLGTCTFSSPNNMIVSTGQVCTVDADCDLYEFCEKVQADWYPPGGNGIGDACDCEGNFDCDEDVDGAEVTDFLADFGRGSYSTPCTSSNRCNGDFLCDGDVDAADVTKFLEDFGRGTYDRPCPQCTGGTWCSY